MNGIMKMFGELAPHMGLVLWALGILLGGLFGSLIVRSVARSIGTRIGIDRLAESTGLGEMMKAVGVDRSLSQLLAQLLFYAGVILTVSSVAELFGLPGVDFVVMAMLSFLPKLLSGAFMLLAGFWVASMVQGLVRRVGRSSDSLDAPDIVARVAYYALVIVTVMLAANQAGLKTELADTVVTVALCALGLACGLGFGLAARPTFESIIARHHYAGELQPGDFVRLADVEGVVVRYTAVALEIATDSGEKLVPCKALHEGTIEVEKIPAPPS